jgi:hypothetical protein
MGRAMRSVLLAMVAIGSVAVEPVEEPSESAMRAAFEARVTSDVQSAVDFARESGGPAAVAKIRAAGTDRFEIRMFQKLTCTRNGGEPGHVCGFMVDIDVVDGGLQSVLVGRFFPGSNGLDFALGS